MQTTKKNTIVLATSASASAAGAINNRGNPGVPKDIGACKSMSESIRSCESL